MDNDEIKSAIQAGWDAMARTYQADSDISLDDIHYAPFAPGERYYGLLGDVSGKRVLELACGGAQNSVTLSCWGADVVALDFLRTNCGTPYRSGVRRAPISDSCLETWSLRACFDQGHSTSCCRRLDGSSSPT